jgi:membrane fusion protein
MPDGLFREEMLASRQDTWLGSIRLQPPRPGWIFFGFGLFCIGAILSLLIGGHYTRHEQVDGALVPSGGLLVITPVSPGVVANLLVREGEEVDMGQPLLEISSEQDSAAMGRTHAAIATQLQIKHDRLQADLSEQGRLAGLQELDLGGRVGLLRLQIAQMSQQMALQEQRANSAMGLYEQWSKLGNTGIVSKLQLLQQHDTALQNQVELKALAIQKSQLQQQAEQLESELAQLPAITAAKNNETARQLSDVAQALSQNAVQGAVIFRAPAKGTVANILVHLGQAVISQQSLMTVLPADSQLFAELWVPTHAMGFVRTGEAVVIRYPAYPYQKFGQHIGHVREVSRSAVLPADVSRLLGKEVREPRYRVQVSLEKQSVLAYGQAESLKPGMVVKADILLDRRRLIEWVIAPLSGFARGAQSQGESIVEAP